MVQRVFQSDHRSASLRGPDLAEVGSDLVEPCRGMFKTNFDRVCPISDQLVGRRRFKFGRCRAHVPVSRGSGAKLGVPKSVGFGLEVRPTICRIRPPIWPIPGQIVRRWSKLERRFCPKLAEVDQFRSDSAEFGSSSGNLGQFQPGLSPNKLLFRNAPRSAKHRPMPGEESMGWTRANMGPSSQSSRARTRCAASPGENTRCGGANAKSNENIADASRRPPPSAMAAHIAPPPGAQLGRSAQNTIQRSPPNATATQRRRPPPPPTAGGQE